MNREEYTKMFELEDQYWWFVGRRRLALDLLQAAPHPQPLSPGGERGVGSILDIGCGTGVVSRELQKRGRVLSLDMSDLALGYCRQRGLTECVRGDGTRLPLRGGQFDAIVGLDIFEHIEDDLAAFRECFRVLEPGGVLVLSVPAFASLWGPHDVALHHFRRYRKAEMKKKLESAGFRVERCSYSVFFLFPVVVLTRIIEKGRTGPARASLPPVPRWLNSALIWLQQVEATLIASWKLDLPWGSSVVVVARKI
ncbi:MAG TPA: class I SAM-dependent methyltransferase [Fimbriimonas sp.]|nr:class I SAM-dependent methyltransferase [Fimbriimonas sp.]